MEKQTESVQSVEGFDWTEYMDGYKIMACHIIRDRLLVLRKTQEIHDSQRMSVFKYGSWQESIDFFEDLSTDVGSYWWCLEILGIDDLGMSIYAHIMDQIKERGSIEVNLAFLQAL
jgi:hypothetical protein